MLGGMAFSRLIKTFLPGLIMALSFVGYYDLVASIGAPPETFLHDVLARNVGLAATVLVPASLFLGLLSNMLVFLRLQRPRRNRTGERQRNMDALSALEDEIKLDHWRRSRAEFGWPPLTDDEAAAEAKLLNVDYLLHPAVTGERMAQLKDSYWYYMEFQRNSVLALGLALPPLMAVAYGEGSASGAAAGVAGAAAVAAVASLVFFLLTRGARENAYQFQRRRVSLLAAGGLQLRTKTTDG
ncbi:hypothetical protein QOZ88_06755 [Blastococcus sp. BMG 814]|uniref:SMODS and SLOG-associating 2TM effector domain-containing protein n=1 Tax=Blastococcus carthaginiensis TaxID=3050034 RepID=A0ABT9I9T1_9ACTN|nr:hypothetical protein [Blastococcus carthaginiensis]MDP5182333.1 hypothetical protein [Blastococcus carthaginiensis]